MSFSTLKMGDDHFFYSYLTFLGVYKIIPNLGAFAIHPRPNVCLFVFSIYIYISNSLFMVLCLVIFSLIILFVLPVM